jgi:hypothetical protein
VKELDEKYTTSNGKFCGNPETKHRARADIICVYYLTYII